MLCIGGVLLPAGSPARVSSTRKATSPFLYFHTSRFYLKSGRRKPADDKKREQKNTGHKPSRSQLDQNPTLRPPSIVYIE
jgi:hypothetical protein